MSKALRGITAQLGRDAARIAELEAEVERLTMQRDSEADARRHACEEAGRLSRRPELSQEQMQALAEVCEEYEAQTEAVAEIDELPGVETVRTKRAACAALRAAAEQEEA